MLVVSAAVGFLLWYTVVREAHEIQPLVPALQELVDEAARAGQLHRLRHLLAGGHGGLRLPDQAAGRPRRRWYKLTPLWLLGVVLCFVPMAFRQRARRGRRQLLGRRTAAIAALIAAGILLGRKRIAAAPAAASRCWTT